MAILSGPFVKKDAVKKFVLGPVLIPEEPDSDGDTVSAERIEEVAHKFAKDYQNIDVQHTTLRVGDMVETYILPVDLDAGELGVVPQGSWMLGVQVSDDNTWAAVERGDLAGFSIMAVPSAVMKSERRGEAVKRTTLADLGDEWEVNFVSLVDNPAVPRAKFVAMKRAAEKGALPGLMQALKDSEIEDAWGNTGDAALFDLEAVFSDHAIVGLGKGQHVRVEYHYDSASKAVVIDGREPVEPERVINKVKRWLGVGKEGRVLSLENREKLETADRLIKEVLGIGERDKEGEDEMDREQVQELVNEAVKSAVEEALPGSEHGGEGETTMTPDEVAEKVEEMIDNAMKRRFAQTGFTRKRLEGQDGGDGDEPRERDLGDRDAFGRKRRHK